MLLRLGPDGEVVWETSLEAAEGSATSFQVHAVGATEGDVFALISIDAPLATPDGALPNLGLTRAVLARLDGASGALEAAVGLGEGGLTGAVMRGRPDGGVVLLGRPTGRFATPLAIAPQTGNTHVIAAFSRELAPRFTQVFTTGAGGGAARPVDLAVDAEGWTLVAGQSDGYLRVGEARFGGQGRATPLFELTPCGDLERPRSFSGRMEFNTISLAGDGGLIAGGGFMSDIYEPPFYAAFAGKLPTPSSPTGGTNNLVMRLERGARGGDWALFCDPGPSDPARLEVELAGSGLGRVISDPPGIDCPGTCAATFAPLTPVRLEATPAEHTGFAGFSDAPFSAADCLDGPSCALTLGTDISLRAHFDAATLEHVMPLDETPQAVVMAARAGRVAVGSRGGILIAEDGETVGLTAVADFSERRRSCGTPSEPRRPTESHRWCDAGRPTKV